MVGFGQRKCTGLIKGRHVRQPALALFLGPQQEDRTQAQIGVHTKERAYRTDNSTKLARQQPCLTPREPRRPVALNEAANDAELFERRQNFVRELCVLPVIVNDRSYVLDAELADFIAQYDFLLSQFNVEHKEIRMFDELVRYYQRSPLSEMTNTYVWKGYT